MEPIPNTCVLERKWFFIELLKWGFRLDFVRFSQANVLIDPDESLFPLLYYNTRVRWLKITVLGSAIIYACFK